MRAAGARGTAGAGIADKINDVAGNVSYTTAVTIDTTATDFIEFSYNTSNTANPYTFTLVAIEKLTL